MVQVLVVRVDIGVVIYEAITPQCCRSMVQVLAVRVDLGVECFRSVVQVVVIRVDKSRGELRSYGC